MGVYTLHTSGSETSSGTGTAQTMTFHSAVGLFVNVTAASGTLPGLMVKLQHSPDGTIWFDVSNIPNSTLSSTGLYNLSPSTAQTVADYVRCSWTLTGVNPNFTFDVQLVVVGS